MAEWTLVEQKELVDSNYEHNAFEFSNINPAYQGDFYQYAYMTKNPFKRHGAVVKLNVETGELLEAEMPNGLFPTEPIFLAAPDAKAEDDGVVLMSGVDGRQGKGFLMIYNASTMELMLHATAPKLTLLGLHSRFYRFDQGCEFDDCSPDVGSTVSSTVGSTVSTTAGSTVSSTADSTVSSTESSTVYSTASSAVSSTAESTVSSTEGSTVSSTASSAVSSTAGSTVSSTVGSTVSSTAGSAVSSTAGSTVSSTAGSTVSSTAGSTVSSTQTSAPVTTSSGLMNIPNALMIFLTAAILRKLFGL